MSRKMTIDEFKDKLNQVTPELNKAMTLAIKQTCEKIRSDIVHSMNTTQRNSEKSYYTNNKKIPHHPSLPGNPPAPDSGRLKNSINYEVDENKTSDVIGRVGSTLKNEPYGAYLEFGASKRNLLPRPWLRPAMESNEGFIKDNFMKAVKTALERMK